ncbi:uncharacterized protein LOC108667849 [Hyalella azteca]|uniref:Uncharacterized protein LOC108667849 n=1 Tax=Hyalella azteca TaxID=294128 RepID=A0A8B7NA23_HYAAZ|nr:uncharacterized protein LOC108667849 [Hyalella azteca]
MNAVKLYVSTCRLVLKADFEKESSWSDLDCLLSSLRTALSCFACGKTLSHPHSSNNAMCQHHVCKSCLDNNLSLKVNCCECKNYQMFSENKQLSILLECYKQLCEYIKISPLFQKLVEYENVQNQNELLAIVGHENISDTPVVLNSPVSQTCIPVPNVCSSDEVVSPENGSPMQIEIQAKIEKTWSFDGLSENNVFNDVENSSNVCMFENRHFKNINHSENYLDQNIKGETSQSIENAPVLSPIPEQSDIICSGEIAPALSPILFNPDQLKVIKSTIGEPIFPNVKIPSNLVNSKIELSTSSNYETETNSDSSSLSSISSSLEISPVLHPLGNSPDNPVQEQLDEFNLVPSFTAASVLGLPSSPDLVVSSAADVLESLEEEETYDDLSNINLSACPLSTIEEEDVQNEVTSLANSGLSFSIVPSSLSVIPEKDSKSVLNNLPKIHERNVSLTKDSSLLYISESIKSKLPPCTSVSLNEPTSISQSQTNSTVIASVASGTAQLMQSVSINNVQKANPVIAPHPLTISSSANSLPQTIVSNLSPTKPSTNYLVNNINQCLITPILSPNLKTSMMSPDEIQTIIASNALCSINSSLLHTPLSGSSVLQTSVVPNVILQQAPSQIVHKAMTSEPLMASKPMHPIIPKGLPNTLNGNALVVSTSDSNSLIKSCNLLLTPATSNCDSPRLIVGNCNPNLVHQTFHPVMSHPKFNSSLNQNYIPYSVPSTASATASLPISYSLGASTHHSPSIAYTVASTSAASASVSSNFLNIVPAGTIFSTNINDRKMNSETPTKSSPVLNNGASLYSVMFSEGDSTKITIKRTPPENSFVANPSLNTVHKVPQIRPDHVVSVNLHNNQFNPNLLKKPLAPKAKPKPKPKRKGCRCGNATPSPGKLTCCGQRCPCYVEAKACIECRCKGCRNPHRPGGKKVRPVIPHQANIRIHQIKPVTLQPAVNNCHGNSLSPVIGIPISVSNQFSQQGSANHMSGAANNYVAPSVSSSSSTIRTLQAIHAVKAVQGITSVPKMVSGGQIFNLKDSIAENSLAVNISQKSIVPTSNMVSVKAMKFQFDTPNNPLLNLDNFPHSIETDNSDVEIDS